MKEDRAFNRKHNLHRNWGNKCVVCTARRGELHLESFYKKCLENQIEERMNKLKKQSKDKFLKLFSKLLNEEKIVASFDCKKHKKVGMRIDVAWEHFIKFKELSINENK